MKYLASMEDDVRILTTAPVESRRVYPALLGLALSRSSNNGEDRFTSPGCFTVNFAIIDQS